MHYSKATALMVGALVTPMVALGSTWTIDSSHTTPQFSVRHLMVSNVQGLFGATKGTVELDDKDITKSKVEVTIDATTIDTREAKRDEHLKSPDFLDTAKHPTITFKSTKIEKGAGNKLKVTGDLTIKGVKKSVTLDTELSPEIKDPWGNVKRGGVASTIINRKDFGLTWNKALETGGVLVGDEVRITIDLELNKQEKPTKS